MIGLSIPANTLAMLLTFLRALTIISPTTTIDEHVEKFDGSGFDLMLSFAKYF